MNPLNIIYYFFNTVFGFVKSGIDWRRMINAYESQKTILVAENYRFRIFPLEFISLRGSAFAYNPNYNNLTGQRSGGENYAHTYIKVNDIYPFILNAGSSAVFVQSFRKNDPSALDGFLLNVVYGYVLGPDGKYRAIDANHVAFDQPGTPGILSFYINDQVLNRKLHAIVEKGKAYALAPNVRPNLITDAQVLVKGENWIYGVIIMLIFITIIIKSKQKAKK